MLKSQEKVSAPSGAFVFTGQVDCDRNIYVKGNFISKGTSFKAITGNVVILLFKSIEGMKIMTDERMSVLNEKDDESL